MLTFSKFFINFQVFDETGEGIHVRNAFCFDSFCCQHNLL